MELQTDTTTEIGGSPIYPPLDRVPAWVISSELFWVSLALIIWRLWLERIINSLSHNLSFNTNIDKDIHGVLWQILAKNGCQRVLLCQFHNGGKFNSGFPFLKLSTTHEVRQPNIISIRMSVQNMPISFLADELNTLVDAGGLIIAHREQRPEACQSYLKSINVETVAEILIGTASEPVGLLLCHWTGAAEPDLIAIKEDSLGVQSLLKRRVTVFDVLTAIRRR